MGERIVGYESYAMRCIATAEEPNAPLYSNVCVSQRAVSGPAMP